MFVSDDHRRTLIEWVANKAFCTSKVIIAKSSSPIGDHYHLQKNEQFLLISGMARRVVLGATEEKNVLSPRVFDVPKGMYHLFELEPGSILIGVADKPHDASDEIKR